MQCEDSQAPRQRRQKRAALQRRLTGLNPAGLGGMGDWDRLTGSARGRLSACLYVCMSPPSLWTISASVPNQADETE